MILLIDFGSQTTHLIKRRLSRMGVRVAKVKSEQALSAARKISPAGIIFSGGPASVYEPSAPGLDKRIFDLNLPILGICYGLQILVHSLGGKVVSGNKEYGPELLQVKDSPLFAGLPERFTVWMSHGDEVVSLPAGFSAIASTKSVRFAGVQNLRKKIFAVQFHPEIYHTRYGEEIFQNFLKICGLQAKKRSLDLEEILEKTRQEYERLGGGAVVAAVSGGVDSSVAAVLTHRAVGEKFFPVYCENGLMRYDTLDQIRKSFPADLQRNLRVVYCQKEFFQALAGVVDPEQKRKIIGKLYVDFFEREARKIPDARILMQGTIYSDIVETGRSSKNASKIKTHHNVGGLPERMRLKVLEPLKDFYKDEVREIGRMLGLPEEVVERQPFPGPGYAIRIIGEVLPERVEKIRKIDKILNDQLKKAGVYRRIFQSFPVLTGVRSTAVKGDAREYAEVVALRVFESVDVMSADWARLDYQLLDEIVRKIISKVEGISRVVYDITTKPPATMEWE